MEDNEEEKPKDQQQQLLLPGGEQEDEEEQSEGDGSHELEKVDQEDEATDEKQSRRPIESSGIELSFSPDRPVRERKRVVRLVEVIEKQQEDGFQILKGAGTPLKDMPKVTRKLSKIKQEELKLLHTILFGRKGKAPDFKNHILQFSGFVWHENEEKQKSKVHDKLDNCTTVQLLGFCDVFDMPVSSSSARKEDLVKRLLDFLTAPHSTTDTLLSESKQHLISPFKRKRSSRAVPPGSSGKHSKKRCRNDKDASKLLEKDETKITEDDHERGHEERGEAGVLNGHEDAQHSESEKENNIDESADEDGHGSVEAGKEKNTSITISAIKSSSLKKTANSHNKLSERASGHSKQKEMRYTDKMVFSRRKKADTTPKRKKNSPKSHTNSKNTGKNLRKTKAKAGLIVTSGPSNEEMRKLICQILKEIDFNTATYVDVHRHVESNCKKDLSSRKEDIKSIVKEELIKLAEAEVDEEYDEDECSGGLEENELLDSAVLLS